MSNFIAVPPVTFAVNKILLNIHKDSKCNYYLEIAPPISPAAAPRMRWIADTVDSAVEWVLSSLWTVHGVFPNEQELRTALRSLTPTIVDKPA